MAGPAVQGPIGTPPGTGQPNGLPGPVNVPGQAVTVPTGLAYGEAGQLQQAQQVAPLPQAQGPPGAGGGMAQAMQAARMHQKPNLGSLTRPTERPNEPVTAGLPGQPQGTTPPQPPTMSGMLQKLAGATGSGALSALAQRAMAAGQ